MTLIQPSLASPDPVVAIDLGSNSFHLLLASSTSCGQLLPMAVRAQKVQLALDMVDRRLSPLAIERGLSCLRDFAEFTRGMHTSRVKVVGTQALRQAVNQLQFTIPASDILGHPIEIVSGEQEAVLAYHGFATEWRQQSKHAEQLRLVVDVGGGSTELVIGRGDQAGRACSVEVGCVTGLQYFPGGTISAANMDTAQQAARAQFDHAAQLLGCQWQLAVGCSGTLLAVEQVLIQQGWSQQGINRQGLLSLRQALLGFERIDVVEFRGLCEQRRSIFATGVAITLGLFEALNLQTMQLSRGGLREGIAWRLLQGF
jgi:exopolyphosphatase/guanosine-5'-triphosphate,3'-diphosphate pyrophosphatase